MYSTINVLVSIDDNGVVPVVPHYVCSTKHFCVPSHAHSALQKAIARHGCEISDVHPHTNDGGTLFYDGVFVDNDASSWSSDNGGVANGHPICDTDYTTMFPGSPPG